MSQSSEKPVNILLVVGAGCPHCHLVSRHLHQLSKEGRITHLETIRLDEKPELVQQLAIRSVPWLRVGPFELEGSLSLHELRQWIERVNHPRGLAIYFDDLFSRGQRHKVESLVRKNPSWLQAFVQLLGDEEVGINTRLGVGVVLEEIADSGLAAAIVHELGEICHHPSPRLRGDACYYLPWTRSSQALPYLQACLNDPHPDVREAALEALETLESTLAGCISEEKGS
ncbi:MAG: HEAT repeat domain-containing protein [Magnetococcales bacterium]|nr:HEAT repeat domain-containing protein [Magnetococcales bacterium]